MTNFDVIVDHILDEKCVLMIGPELAMNEKGVPLHEDLRNYFEREADIQFDDDIDNFIIFKNKSGKTIFYSDLKKYYQKYSQPGEIHEKLARIPFHLIVSVSPDVILRNTFDKLGIDSDFQFYNKKENPKDIQRPDKKNPLLYNLFGSITEVDSLIITHDDLFDFLFSILGGEQRLPRELKNTLISAKVFLFLGFDFEKWYMKLILRLFELHKDPMSVANNGSVIDEKIKNFYIKNFEMNFISENISTLVDELYKRFEHSKNLRETDLLKVNPVASKVKILIKNGSVKEALEILNEYLQGKDEDMNNLVIQNLGSYNSLQAKIEKGTLKEEDANIQLARLRESILYVADQVGRNIN